MPTHRLEDFQFETEVLRYTDGSIDVAAYVRIAQEERLTAMHESIRELYNAVRGLVPVSGRHFAPKQTLSSKAC